jgi:hypothetical protein
VSNKVSTTSCEVLEDVLGRALEQRNIVDAGDRIRVVRFLVTPESIVAD